MIDKNRKYWNEIISGQLNFERDEQEVECLRTLTQEDILSFYMQHIASHSTRRKLSLRMVSLCGVDTDNPSTGSEINTIEDEAADIIKDVTTFKSTLPLYPLLKSSKNP